MADFQSNTTGNLSGQQHAGTAGTNTTSGAGDMLDKAVDFAERKAGHEQSHSTTEKISDGLRKGFQKVTGKDVPVQDKQYQ